MLVATALPSLVPWNVWFSFPNITLVALIPFSPSTPSIPSLSLDIVLISDEPSLAVTLNDIEFIVSVYKFEVLATVRALLFIVNPLLPLVTLTHVLPLSTLYCHLPYVQLVKTGVNVIVFGV